MSELKKVNSYATKAAVCFLLYFLFAAWSIASEGSYIYNTAYASLCAEFVLMLLLFVKKKNYVTMVCLLVLAATNMYYLMQNFSLMNKLSCAATIILYLLFLWSTKMTRRQIITKYSSFGKIMWKIGYVPGIFMFLYYFIEWNNNGGIDVIPTVWRLLLCKLMFVLAILFLGIWLSRTGRLTTAGKYVSPEDEARKKTSEARKKAREEARSRAEAHLAALSDAKSESGATSEPADRTLTKTQPAASSSVIETEPAEISSVNESEPAARSSVTDSESAVISPAEESQPAPLKTTSSVDFETLKTYVKQREMLDEQIKQLNTYRSLCVLDDEPGREAIQEYEKTLAALDKITHG